MAEIILAPGETFEHTHDQITTSGVVSGNVELHMEGKIIKLNPNEKVTVPANVSHKMVNVGNSKAIARCNYNC